MALSAGTRLGPYEIIVSIGAGGMGEVYRAKDTRLHRDVAVKVSAAQFTDRFEREARAVAALNHPNICTLHDIGPNYLVMELVEGPTLAHRIKQGAIPLEEALDIARQIANALEAAHEKGVVHRDLKPGNVNITPNGVVKVLDFGLAKMAEPADSGGRTENSPTLTVDAATRVGVILGTAAYMPPEQARGKIVDKRADIWAFGVVLYEMLTGQRLFEGETISDTLIEVATKEPEWNRVPAKVQRLLRRCLEKDPKRRLRDLGDVWAWLEDAPQAEVVAEPAGKLGHRLAWSAAALFFVIAALLSLTHFGERPLVAETVRFQIPAPEKSNIFAGPFLSPDGRRVAFSATDGNGQASLWVRTLDSLESRRLAGTENVTGTQFWSPDSRFIGFATQDKLKKVDASGGLPQTICDLSNQWRGGAWSPAGVIIFGTLVGLMRVSEAGGTPTPLTLLDPARQEITHSSPTFLPDGRHFVYLRISGAVDKSGVYLGSLDVKPEQQTAKRLLASASGIAYAASPDPATGHLFYVREGSLMAQPFSNRRLEMTGESVPIADDLNEAGAPRFSVSATGALAFRSGDAAGQNNSRLTWFDKIGKMSGTVGEPGLYNSIALSPDGTRVAVSRSDRTGGNTDLWVHEFSRGTSTRLTFDPSTDWMATWSPDGGRIAFSSLRGGSYDLYQKVANGAGGEDLLLKSSEMKYAFDWSQDGRFLLYAASGGGGYDLWVLPLTGDEHRPRPYLQTQFRESQAQFSPDSRWVAYSSDASGKSEVYVQPFPMATGGKWMVSQGGGSQPRWRQDGKELFYISVDSKVMAVDVAATPAFKAKVPKALFATPILGATRSGSLIVTRYDVTADGKKFLINSLLPSNYSPTMTVVLNWQTGLKK